MSHVTHATKAHKAAPAVVEEKVADKTTAPQGVAANPSTLASAANPAPAAKSGEGFFTSVWNVIVTPFKWIANAFKWVFETIFCCGCFCSKVDEKKVMEQIDEALDGKKSFKDTFAALSAKAQDGMIEFMFKEGTKNHDISKIPAEATTKMKADIRKTLEEGDANEVADMFRAYTAELHKKLDAAPAAPAAPAPVQQ